MAFFVTFYSYKGGVGRSLALANVAYSLAAAGKRVVLVDMDLEAPGLHDIPEFALKGPGSKKGLVEYADAFRRQGKCPSITSHVHRCKESPGTGEIWLMPAGRFGSEYQHKLATLSWRKLHPRKGTAPFIEELRRAIADEIRPHYVLIDARTGLSDVGGLSTHRLADMIVLVSNLTLSCLEGSVRAYRSFVAGESKISVQLVASPVPPLVPETDSPIERRLQRAAEHMPYARPWIRVVYDPGIVLAEKLAVRQPELFPAAIRYEEVQRSVQETNPEDVFSVLEHALALRGEGDLEGSLSLLREYVQAHPQNADAHLALGNLIFEAGRRGDAIQAFRTASQLDPHLALAQRRLGEALVSEERAAEAVEILEQAAKLGDESRELYVALARAYGQLNQLAKELEARRKSVTSCLRHPDRLETLLPTLPDLRKDFIRVLGRKPPFPGFDAEAFWDQVIRSLVLGLSVKAQLLRKILNSPEIKIPREISRGLQEEGSRWLEILGPYGPELQRRVGEQMIDVENEAALLKLRQGDEFDAVLFGLLAVQAKEPKRRAELLEEATRIDPRNTALLFVCGATLSELAQLADSDERRDLLRQAIAKYQQALAVKPDLYEALVNWGSSLAALAQLAGPEERKDLLLQVIAKYEQALAIKPDLHQAIYSWGNILAILAQLAAPEEKRELFRQAIRKYDQALAVMPDKHEALYNWGLALDNLARLAEPEERKDLVRQAIAKYEQALAFKPDLHEALYNWGLALDHLAQLAEPEERKDLFRQAIAKYEQTLTVKPDKHEALVNWVSVLLRLADLTEEEEAGRLFIEAAEKAREVNRLQPGAGDYNLACALSRLGSFEEAAPLLEIDLQREPQRREHALEDPDLQPLWSARPDFRAAVERDLKGSS